ncbi:hypothetical protein HZA56_22800 [Candidatus Poribacteria bacterium]|nr:hypothetical protein [Candidatus Poribacteria bacterium]
MKKWVFLVSAIVLFSLGWFSNYFFPFEKAIAAKPVEYKVVNIQHSEDLDAKNMERILNTISKEGWKFHSIYGSILIFEK